MSWNSPGETPPQSHHDWQHKGEDLNQKHMWVCRYCRNFVRIVGDFKPPPEFRSSMWPCDEETVRYVMES